jgi:uncharacterized Fe-S cluster protein YjdI
MKNGFKTTAISMPKSTPSYTNGKITIVWKSATCIHSTLCRKGLVKVFNPEKRPWIDINAASTD